MNYNSEYDIHLNLPDDTTPAPSEVTVTLPSLEDWHKVDFVAAVSSNINGVNKTNFLEAVARLQSAISQLPSLHAGKMRDEINEWDLSTPEADAQDSRELQAAYNRFTAYRFRLLKMLDVAHSHLTTFDKAYKMLKTLAVGLFRDGTQKDKEANAENVVNVFLMGTVKPESLVKYLTELRDDLNFATTNMARALREREVEVKQNFGHQSDGAAFDFDRSIGKKDRSPVETRKRFSADSRDWDGT